MRDLKVRSPFKLSKRDLPGRLCSLHQVSLQWEVSWRDLIQDLYKSSVGNLWKRSLGKIPEQDLHKEVSWQDLLTISLLARVLYECLVMCEPAQAICTWTFHTNHFVSNLQGNAGRFQYYLDKTPGLNTYRKNPSVWLHGSDWTYERAWWAVCVQSQPKGFWQNLTIQCRKL